MLRKTDGAHVTEYPVDPAQLALALAAKVRFDTGLLAQTTLLIRQEGVKKTVIEYRTPQKTGLYLDGSETALRLPLPGLIFVRVTTEDKNPQYQVYAVKKRPDVLNIALFHAPLPNVFNSGTICWGSVPLVSEQALRGSSLAEDWRVLLGSRFGDHGVQSKSKAFMRDVRQQFIALEARKARVYPKSDLVPVQRSLAQVLGEER
ncbi:MAG: hypothetical protein ABI700_01050 [Chloroflexota bacterium]